MVGFQTFSEFQSTLSVRRATGLYARLEQPDSISIHALRKESDVLRANHVAMLGISIHALRKESDFTGVGKDNKS